MGAHVLCWGSTAGCYSCTSNLELALCHLHLSLSAQKSINKIFSGDQGFSDPAQPLGDLLTSIQQVEAQQIVLPEDLCEIWKFSKNSSIFVNTGVPWSPNGWVPSWDSQPNSFLNIPFSLADHFCLTQPLLLLVWRSCSLPTAATKMAQGGRGGVGGPTEGITLSVICLHIHDSCYAEAYLQPWHCLSHWKKNCRNLAEKSRQDSLQVCDECLQNSYCCVKLGKYLDQLIMILILWRYPVLPLKIHSVIHCKQMLFQEFLLFTSWAESESELTRGRRRGETTISWMEVMEELQTYRYERRRLETFQVSKHKSLWSPCVMLCSCIYVTNMPQFNCHF